VRLAIDCSFDDFTQSEKWDPWDDRDNPEQHYARQQRASILSGAMQRLRPASRRVLELQQSGELSTKEIAQSLGISEPPVKSRLLRARGELRQVVQRRTQHCHTNCGSESALMCN